MTYLLTTLPNYNVSENATVFTFQTQKDKRGIQRAVDLKLPVKVAGAYSGSEDRTRFVVNKNASKSKSQITRGVRIYESGSHQHHLVDRL